MMWQARSLPALGCVMATCMACCIQYGYGLAVFHEMFPHQRRGDDGWAPPVSSGMKGR
ncbi:hypothetical protein L227DRAFT_571549 [Lentinus tigrinus ALCF2SS1-6]|uniref:Uncharacterized protein n=1 Tax=Lentinus tigrinus ALCF2SS1-6 TaxID=1328759 RepID=A0A5C2SP63_9APHY|nr:hypothetical protein L227DRAFT_571549 [Lentinus tigrinus ALCF2SS1-6]